MGISALLTLAILAVQAPAPAQPSADTVGRAYYLFIQGRLLDDRDDLAGAIVSYRQAIELLPKASDIHAELAGLFARQGQVPEAQAEAEAALAIEAGNMEANRVLGAIQASTVLRATSAAPGPLAGQAIGHLEKSIGPGVPDPTTQLTLGQLYLRNNQAAKSIEILKQFLVDRPTYLPALSLLADAYDAAGQPAEAAKVRATLRRGQPDTLETRAAAIDRLERQGQWKEAASRWADLIRASPAAAAGYRTRYATALANSGDFSAASAVLTEITRATPRDVGAWYLLAEVEQRGGHPEAADQAAAQIAQIDPKDPRGPMALAELRELRKDYKGVIQVLAPRVTAAQADDIASGAFTQMAGELSAAYVKMNDRKHAIEVLEAASRHASKDPDLLMSLAAAYDQDHRYDQAERALRDLISADPSNAEALNYLGYMFAERGRNLEEAVTLVNRALAVDVGNPSYLDSLGWAYFKLSQLDKAREPLERAAAALPKASVIQDHLGDVYLQMKRYTDAVSAFERALAGDRDGVDAGTITKKRDRARSLAGKS